MPKKKKQSAGRYSEIVPGLLLGNLSAVPELMESTKLELIAVVNVGGGKTQHPNTLKFHVKDSQETSMFDLFEKTCGFLDTHCQIAMLPLTPQINIGREIDNWQKLNQSGHKTVGTNERISDSKNNSNCNHSDTVSIAENNSGNKTDFQQSNKCFGTPEPILNQAHKFKHAAAYDEFKCNVIQKSVLVHCRAGMHRSPTIVCAYLIHCGYGMDTSLDFIKEKRVIAYPTPSQIEDLRRWEKFVSKSVNI